MPIDAPDPPSRASTTFSAEEEAIVVAFRRHTLLPLDGHLYGLQPAIPHLTRSALHRCLQHHCISRLPETVGDKAARKRVNAYPIGCFHIDFAKLRTEQGKVQLFVAVHRAPKFAFVQLHERAITRNAANFMRALRAAGEVPLPELAAAIGATDVLITVDTMAMHLAGAMGHPCLVLASHQAPGFVLGVEGDCGWYPQAWLVRRGVGEPWAEAVGRLAMGLTSESWPSMGAGASDPR